MKASELFTKITESGNTKAAELLYKRTACFVKTQLFVADTDDAVYNSGLAEWLQNNCTWFNNRNKNGFTVIFK